MTEKDPKSTFCSGNADVAENSILLICSPGRKSRIDRHSLAAACEISAIPAGLSFGRRGIYRLACQRRKPRACS
ncbi:hypothetical protein AB0D38_48870, partial [Streptomyces sp. NPDC048279]|uniref:hypothetical protein n=1 Tax=Streptomyces sp. NPDC048279 TaxID=3154714 RepID=UPI00341428C4